MLMIYNVTGKAYKHHIEEDFTREGSPLPVDLNGAGTGATIFLSFKAMIRFMEEDGRKFYVAELDLKDEPINFNQGTDTMAITTRPISSHTGFMPVAKMFSLRLNNIANLNFQCYVLGDKDGNYFSGEIFLSRASITDYRPHAKEYKNRAAAEKELNAAQAATDVQLEVIPKFNKYIKTER